MGQAEAPVTARPAFTPGPWIAEYDEDEDEDAHIIGMGSYLKNPGVFSPQHRIRYDHSLYPDEDAAPARAQFAEADANARLIAAAPELYEALRRVAQVFPNGLCWCLDDLSDQHGEECVAARAALAKADGRAVTNGSAQP